MGIRGKRITLEYETVTPMFLGGATGDAVDLRFRELSIRGALAFWWRALNCNIFNKIKGLMSRIVRCNGRKNVPPSRG